MSDPTLWITKQWGTFDEAGRPQLPTGRTTMAPVLRRADIRVLGIIPRAALSQSSHAFLNLHGFPRAPVHMDRIHCVVQKRLFPEEYLGIIARQLTHVAKCLPPHYPRPGSVAHPTVLPTSPILPSHEPDRLKVRIIRNSTRCTEVHHRGNRCA